MPPVVQGPANHAVSVGATTSRGPRTMFGPLAMSEAVITTMSATGISSSSWLGCHGCPIPTRPCLEPTPSTLHRYGSPRESQETVTAATTQARPQGWTVSGVRPSELLEPSGLNAPSGAVATAAVTAVLTATRPDGSGSARP